MFRPSLPPESWITTSTRSPVLAPAVSAARAEATARGEDPVLAIYSDRDAPFGEVAAALDAAKRAGQQRIAFPMRPH